MEECTRKGILYCHVRIQSEERRWQKRFYVLHSGCSGRQARWDFYDTEQSYNQNVMTHGTMYIGDINKIRTCKVQDQKHTFEILLKNGMTRTFAAENDKEVNEWLRCLQKEKEAEADRKAKIGYNIIAGLKGSHKSLDRDDLPAYDENVLYESAEEPVIFEVEVTESASSLENNLAGTYNFLIGSLNMTLSDKKSGQAKLVWPYRYIRRYGRSRTTFTFEAGRKCVSGEGYFTFKVENGDKIFGTVYEKTNEMKEKGSTLRNKTNKRDSDDYPDLPTRKYLNEEDEKNTATAESNQSISERIKKLQKQGSKDKDKVKPPVLKKKPTSPKAISETSSSAKPTVSQKPVLERMKVPPPLPPPRDNQPDSPSENYELAKTIFQNGDKTSPTPMYEEGERLKSLNVNYEKHSKQNSLEKGNSLEVKNGKDFGDGSKKPLTSPVYAIYDVSRSSRFVDGESAVYDDPADPSYEPTSPFETTGSKLNRGGTTSEYAEPFNPKGELNNGDIYDEPDGPPASAMSNINDKLKNKMTLSGKNIPENQYDHIELQNPGGSRATRYPRAPLPAIPGSSTQYGQLSSPQGLDEPDGEYCEIKSGYRK